MDKIRPNTKWFSYDRAKNVQTQLAKRGIQTQIVKTTKINKIMGIKRPAYLVEKTPFQVNKESGK